MKRVLLFVLVFGGGLALLLFLAQKAREEKSERAEQTTGQLPVDAGGENPFQTTPPDPGDGEAAAGDPEPGPEEGADPQDPTDDGPEVRIQIGGTFNGWIPDEEGRRLYDFKLNNIQPQPGEEYVVDGATLRKLDVEDGSVDTRVVAKQAWVRIDTAGRTYALSRTEPIRLREAVVTLLGGSPLAPITLELPEAEYDLGTGTLTSSSNVRVLGDGLFGTGNGLIASQENQVLELQRDGYLRLRTEDDADIELRAAGEGEIVFERLELRRGVEKVEVRLEQGGELTVKGETDVKVEGDSLTLDGRVEETNETTSAPGEEPRTRRAFVPEYTRIEGDVVFTRGTETVTGATAEVFFDAAGEVSRLKVFDEPTARGLILLDSKDGAERQPMPLELTGLGPMELEYSSESPVAEFSLPGPATLSAPMAGLRVDAGAAIEGRFWGRGLVNLELRGEVTGRFDDVDFEGRDVSLRGSERTEAIRRVYLETESPAHFSGTTDRGEPFDVRSEGVLQLELQRDETRLVLGRDVTLEMGEAEREVTIVVSELRDLDVEARSFEATGGMTYTTPEGSGEAARATGHSREHIELFGDEERPATFDLDASESQSLDAGFVRARHIDVRPDRVLADELVELRFEDPDYTAEIDCNWFELRLLEERVEGRPTPFEFEAREIERAAVKGEEVDTTFLARTVAGTGRLIERADGATELELESVAAAGDVSMSYDGGGGRFTATGGRLRWDPDGVARLEALAGERVEARGRFREDGLPYVLTASWIEYGSDDIQALFPEITLDRPAALPQPLSGGLAVELHSGGAEWMTADAAGILLAGSAYFSGLTEDGQQVDLTAGSMHLLRTEENDEQDRGMQELVAWDGFELQLEDDLTGTGEILQVGYEVLRFEGRPARVEVSGFVWESNNIVYDVPRVLITTDQGTLYGAPGTASEGWTATYESLQPFETADSTMMVMRNPVLRAEGRELSGKWATFWLDRDEWLEKTSEWLGDEETERPEVPVGPEPAEDVPEPLAPTLFGGYDPTEASRVLKEFYLEGDIRYLIDGERVAEMQAFYVDLVLGHGWIQDAELHIDAKAGSLETPLAVRADWLRHSSDGSLSADHAEVTACNFAEPHYYVRTRNLRLTPVGDGSSVWDVLLKDNAVVFDNGLRVPLPKVHYKSDGKGRPTFGGLRAGNSARFGSFIEASVDVDVSEGVAETVAPLLNTTAEEIDSRYRLRGSYYGNRGLLVDQRFRVTAGDHFWMDTFLNGIYDSGEDRGFLRYKEEGGSELRWQLSTLGRYGIRDEEWVDFQIATQSDLGVQAEFEESQFVAYERRDTFARWRKADDELYYSAIARYRIDDFRNDVERLPEAGVLRSLTPVTELWGQPLLYTASADAGYLRVRQSNEGPISPFDPNLDPTLGNRDYLRADTRHRLEAPFDLGAGGVRVSPYTSVAATAWEEGVQTDDSPSRGAVLAGVEAQTNLFRTWKYGIVNSITPFVGVRGDLASFEDGGEQIQVDPLDEPLVGRFVDLGVRGRWRVPGGARYLDASIRQSHADDVAPGEEDGWRPARVLAELVAVYQGVPFAITHDGLYDFDDGQTPLSFTSLSLLPVHDLGVEVSYNRGLDQNRDVLYDAIGLGARWDATRKWQIEGQHSISQLDGQALSSNLLVRRVGHDFIFELVYGFRSGEGSSIAFKYRPLLGWNQPNFGLMQVLQRARL